MSGTISSSAPPAPQTDNDVGLRAKKKNLKKTTQINLLKMEVDIVFQLDVRLLPTATTSSVGHHFILTASKATSKVRQSGLNIKNLVDLGVITFFTERPDIEQDLVRRVERNQSLWTARNGLVEIWSALSREIDYYQRLHLTPPQVPSPRRLQFGVTGLKYFRAFDSPDLNPVPSTFVCNYAYVSDAQRITQTALPSLFR